MSSSIEIRIMEHKDTGLLMAVSAEIPGFIVHAHSDEEMEDKLIPAFKAYMEAIGKPVEAEYDLVDKSTPGFWPPVFVLQEHKAAA